MIKKEYQKPSTRIVPLQYQNTLLAGSTDGYDEQDIDIDSTIEIDEEDVW